jgi:hypothetical protein
MNIPFDDERKGTRRMKEGSSGRDAMTKHNFELVEAPFLDMSRALGGWQASHAARRVVGCFVGARATETPMVATPDGGVGPAWQTRLVTHGASRHRSEQKRCEGSADAQIDEKYSVRAQHEIF